jgi:hypothetical protein
MRPRTREEIADAWDLPVDKVPERGRKKRGGIRFANRGAVAGVAEYRAFAFPAGSGKTWRVDPLDYLTGLRIAELQIALSEIQQQAEAIRDAERVQARDAWELQRQFSAYAREAAEFVGPLLIPTHRRGKWWAKLRRRFGYNPLRKATHREVAEVVNFLAVCLMISPSRVSQVAALN